NVRHPSGSIFEVFEQSHLVVGIELTTQNGEHLVVHMALTQMAKCLNHGAALASGGGDVAWGGVLEDDFTLAEFDPAGCSVGQENNFHRDLIGKAEDVG